MSTFGAREQIRCAVRAMTATAAGAEPEPLAGLGAAIALGHAAGRAERDCARSARESGRTWTEIGDVLYAGMEPVRARPAEAFHHFARNLGSGTSFSWTCGTCHASIIDRGPETGAPRDAEQGHEPDCARLAEMVRAYGQD